MSKELDESKGRIQDLSIRHFTVRNLMEMSKELDESKGRIQDLSIRIIEMLNHQVDIRELSNSEVIAALLKTSVFWQDNVLIEDIAGVLRQRDLIENHGPLLNPVDAKKKYSMTVTETQLHDLRRILATVPPEYLPMPQSESWRISRWTDKLNTILDRIQAPNH